MFGDEFMPVLGSFAVGWLCFAFLKLAKATVGKSAHVAQVSWHAVAGDMISEPGVPKCSIPCENQCVEVTVPKAPSKYDFVAMFAHLPAEVGAEVSRYLRLQEAARAAGVCHELHGCLWDAAEVWCARAADFGLLPPFGAAAGLDGCFLREAFRMDAFDVGGRRLKVLSEADPALVLEEATRVVRGAMPRDGPGVCERLCKVTSHALQGHDPKCLTSAAAAEAFLKVVRKRTDLWDEGQVEQLEEAHRCALNLQVAMDTVMEEHLSLGALSFSSPENSPSVSGVSVDESALLLEDLEEMDFELNSRLEPASGAGNVIFREPFSEAT